MGKIWLLCLEGNEHENEMNRQTQLFVIGTFEFFTEYNMGDKAKYWLG